MSCPFHNGAQAPAHPAQSSADSANEGTADEPIPQPPIHWFTKNLPEMDPAFPASSIWRLADIYGPIYKLDLVKRQTIVLSSHELINEVCSEDRFDKAVQGPLVETRALLGDGLFTAFPEEPSELVEGPQDFDAGLWAFGDPQDVSRDVRYLFADALEVGPYGPNPRNRDGGRLHNTLAFDTIGLCSMSYRFNSFYLPDIHPFAQELASVLIESGKRGNRPSVENYIRVFSAEENKKNVEAMWNLSDELVAERKANPKPEAKDLLNTMLYAEDPETGEKLSDESIRNNLITFLAAGHETTSGTLSFLFYHLMKNPDKYHKAQAEVDSVIGDSVLELKHLPQLKYVEACIRETLRFQGPISQIVVCPKEDTVLGGRYKVPKGISIVCNLPGLHHDHKVWGDDSDVFRPERMLDGGFEALPANAFKAFGNGRRACIGRAFAEQEMLLVAAAILQRFVVESADNSYDLTLKSTLTVKPQDFKIKVRRRPGKDAMVGLPGGGAPTAKPQVAEHQAKVAGDKPLLILYGSNAGTCKSLAEDLESRAGSAGFVATVDTMNHATEHLPKDTPVIIITPSYEGKPADNARKFVSWLESTSDNGALRGVNFAVLGVGNSEWTSTFHRIPKLVDERMERLGGKRILETGLVDVKEDLVGPWDDFKDALMDALTGGTTGDQSSMHQLKARIESSEAATKLAGQDLARSYGYVRKNKLLAGTEVGPAKRQIDVELPEGVTYRTGDYLVVLPINPPESIKRVLNRFKLHPDDVLNITGTNKTFLTGHGPAPIAEVIGTRVELGTPASQRQIETLARAANDEDREKLQELKSDATFKSEVLAKRKSIIDLLEEFPSCDLPFGTYLDMLQPLSPRQYSISSSPLAEEPHEETGQHGPATASITFDVHEGPALAGGDRIFKGVASSFLAACEVGKKIRCYVRSTNASFHLPKDTKTPIVMIAAGTGIAPMRGFIEERAAIAKAGGQQLGPAILYFGCRHHEKDFIYKDELAEWEKLGAVKVRPTFSQDPPTDGSEHFKYVPDRIWAEREELAKVFSDGAKIFLCGSAGKLAKSSNDVIKKIWLERHPEKTMDDAFEWLQKQRETRYVTDVFD